MKKLFFSSILLTNIGLAHANIDNSSPLVLKFPQQQVIENNYLYKNENFNNFITIQLKKYSNNDINITRNFIDGTVISIRGLDKKQITEVENFYNKLYKQMNTIYKNDYFTDIYISNEKEDRSVHTAIPANNFYLSSGFQVNNNYVMMMLTLSESATVQQNISIMYESTNINLNIPFSYESAPRKYKLNDKYSITIRNINQ